MHAVRERERDLFFARKDFFLLAMPEECEETDRRTTDPRERPCQKNNRSGEKNPNREGRQQT